MIPRNDRPTDKQVTEFSPKPNVHDEPTITTPTNDSGQLTPSLLPSDNPEVLGRLGKYEVQRLLGRGGMGVVYQARQETLDRVVALKMILAGSLASQDHVKRFRAEAEAVARLQHPNIVQIYEVGEHQGHSYFSLEYVDGGTLADRLRCGAMSSREAAQLIETLA